MYIIRIELHHIHNYEALHETMATRSMLRTIPSSDGTLYDLPTGTYCHSGVGVLNGEEVRIAALAAAKEIGHIGAEILVVDAAHCRWSGLNVHIKKRRAG